MNQKDSKSQYLLIPKNLFNTMAFFLMAFFICVRVEAQIHIHENFGVDDGLPSSEIYDIYQDSAGYIWFATDKGLSRYNGYEFENFNTDDGLPGNVVLRFYPQKNGQVWCYTLHSKSLFYFDEKFNGIKQFEYNHVLHKLFHKNSIIKSVYLDKEENVHIGGIHINGEIIIQNNGKVKQVYHTVDNSEDSIFQKQIVLKPLSDSLTSTSYFTTLDSTFKSTHPFYDKYISSRTLVKWLVENEIAIFMNDQYVKLVFRNKEDKLIKCKYSPLGIQPFDENNFFIGYQFGGAKIMDKEGNIIKTYLEDQSVTGFLKDHEGGYWFTTLNSGVFYIKNPSILTFNSFDSKHLEVNSLVKIKDELLIGYVNGVISKMSNNREVVVTHDQKNTSPAFVEYDSQQNKIYLYSDETLRETKNDDFIKLYFLKLSEPVNNTLFASHQNGFYEITENNSYISRLCPYRIHDVCVWNGDTLLATPVGVFEFQNNDCQPLSKKSDLFKFRSDDIDVNNKNNTLYIATQGAGIVINDGNQIFNLTEKDGLNSNIINEVHIENDSTLWACTNRGINRIIWGMQRINITSLNKKDGLLSDEVMDIEIINDTVWVGTKQGLCNFPKSQLIPNIITVPDLMLKDVIVNNASLAIAKSSSLTYKENEIEFRLEGISYANKDNVTYQFRLNENQNWSSTQNRLIQFSALSPGNYTFEAKMCNNDQNCSEKSVKYEFTIQPPYWNRGWFRFLCLCSASLLIYTFFKIKVLTYNKDITRELIRLLVKKLKRQEMYFSFRENGNQVRVKTEDIFCVKSAGNYIDLFTINKTHTIRLNIGKFIDNVPDQLEYVQLHRSYIVRIDKIMKKSKNEVQLSNGMKIPVSLNRNKSLKEVQF